MYLHLWENTFPFFPQGIFQCFRIRQIHLKSVPAHHRPTQGLRLVKMIIVFRPGKLIGCPGYFFHDLGRIYASLFCVPRCSKLMSLGARSFNSQFNLCTDCVAFSPSLACPQHVCLRLTSIKLAVLDGAISHNSLVFFTVPFFFSLIQRYFMPGQPRSGHCFTFSRVGHLRSPLSLNYFGSLLATRDSHT